jgi:DNA-binding response OmpR family regulator
VKTVLVIDESNLCRSFLKSKLSQCGLAVDVAVNGLDGLGKIRSIRPDLIIMDCRLSRTSAREILVKKNESSDTSAIPVILLGRRLDRRELDELGKLGVAVSFSKPVQIDALLARVSQKLSFPIRVDQTPCMVDSHFSGGILFVEIAHGLNHEKLDALKYKMAELAALHGCVNPPILLVMTSVEVTPEDSLKLSVLFSSLLDRCGGADRLKVLTASRQVKDFVQSREEFCRIEVSGNLDHAIDTLLKSSGMGHGGAGAGAKGPREILQSSDEETRDLEDFSTRFEQDRATFDSELLDDSVTVAVVDDDMVIREMVKAVLSDTDVSIIEYENGRQFLEDRQSAPDVVFLDLVMPEVDGFQVLAEQKRHGRTTPIIVMSALGERETVQKAVEYGIHSYLVKPLDPKAVRNKVREVLQSCF